MAFLGSVVQGRLLRLVGGSDTSLGLQQRADGIDLPRLGCDVQCRLAGLVLAVHIDTGLEVLFDGINRADLRGDKNRLRRLLVALARHADAAEVVGQFPLGLTGGEVERGAPLFILGREVGLGLDQQLGHGELIKLGGVVERRLFAVARQVDVRAVGQGELRHRCLAGPGRDVQDRVTVFVLVPDLVVLGEEALDRLDIPLGGGLPNIGGRLVLRFFLCLGGGCVTRHGNRRGGQQTV